MCVIDDIIVETVDIVSVVGVVATEFKLVLLLVTCNSVLIIIGIVVGVRAAIGEVTAVLVAIAVALPSGRL